MQGAADIDATMAHNIARRSRFKERDLEADAEYDHDAGLDLADSRRAPSKDARRRGSAAEEVAKREKAKQVREYNKFSSALERCNLCFASQGRPKHLMLAIGNAAYLALPRRGRLVPGHCQIIPAEHVASTRAADEAAWTEVRNFKKCLLRMFAAQGMECVFMETAAHPESMRAHAVVDCVPLPPDGESPPRLCENYKTGSQASLCTALTHCAIASDSVNIYSHLLLLCSCCQGSHVFPQGH